MSFIGAVEKGLAYAPGFFLAENDGVIRKTKQIAQEGAETAANGGRYVKMGTVWPANDATAEGIVYEDVDVTSGDMPGSVVVRGMVYEDRLPVALADAARTALTDRGFAFVAQAPTVTRP